MLADVRRDGNAAIPHDIEAACRRELITHALVAGTALLIAAAVMRMNLPG
ncbi:hypothetical protein [Methylobacterium soli]|nr:hypothetical protein [Methylobacterium soli]